MQTAVAKSALLTAGFGPANAEISYFFRQSPLGMVNYQYLLFARHGRRALSNLNIERLVSDS